MKRSSLLVLATIACTSTPQPAAAPAPAPAPAAAAPAAPTSATTAREPAPAPVVADTAFRAQPPQPKPAPEFKGPTPTRAVLPNGLTVLTVRQGKLPLVTVAVVLRGGSATDPKGKPGVAGFVGEMLKSGTTTRSAAQLADEIETLGTELAVGVDRDTTSIEATVLTQNLPKLLELLADVLHSSAFAPEEIERVRSARLTALAQERDSPPRAASRALTEVLYGEHPYGHVVLGTTESVKAIKREDVRRHYARIFKPGNAALIFVGDLGPEEAQAHAARALGSWQGRGTAPSIAKVPTNRAAKVVLVPKAGAPQSQLLLGHIGVERKHPDYFPLLLCNAILGGQFNSRINMNLREAKGYTYGASSAFAFTRAPGPFYVSTSVRTEVTKPALQEIFKELDLMKSGTATEDELRDATNGYVLSLPGDFETTSGVASMVSSIFVFDLPLDYYRTIADKLRAVKLEDIKRVASKHLRPQELSIIVVGDEGKVKGQLEELGRGEVEVRGRVGEG